MTQRVENFETCVRTQAKARERRCGLFVWDGHGHLYFPFIFALTFPFVEAEPFHFDFKQCVSSAILVYM